MFNKLIAGVLPYMPKKLVWIFSQRYIAGENLEDGLRVARELNEKGILVTVDLLGEFIKRIEEAKENRDRYLDIIERFTGEGIQGNFSVKPTMFGLLIDKKTCYSYLRDVVKKASEKNSFIRVDMEDSQCVDMELDLYIRLKEEFPKAVGLVVQAYLRRTPNDLENLLKYHTPESPLNFRLCKGIYVEPKEISWKGYDEVRNQYLLLLEFMLKNKIYAGIATHDKFLIDGAYRLIRDLKPAPDMYEFQMLHGVTPELRASIVEKGYKMRVYVPFGKQWFGYSTRRLKENPRMASLIIKALFKRG
ncbi:L-proline dehydrogenase [Bacteroidales bacterium 6E]|nr:L-proline dehydrogenase [Bacteroidales bacterium 6E]